MGKFKHMSGYRVLLNPFIGFQINLPENFSGVNLCKRENSLVVSLTSCKERFHNLPKALYSLLTQELKPDRIVLWLDESENDLTTLPYDITQFIKNGLEIKFVKDLKSYTKIIYAFKEFPSSIIVNADDDIYYQPDWLKLLYMSYVSHPEDIHVHKAIRVNPDLTINVQERSVKEETARFDNFIIGSGGILYPPNCFTKEVLREDIFLKNAPNSDDLWFWVMALVNNRKLRVVNNHIKTLISLDIIPQIFKNRNLAAPEELKNLYKFYGQNIQSKLRHYSNKT